MNRLSVEYVCVRAFTYGVYSVFGWFGFQSSIAQLTKSLCFCRGVFVLFSLALALVAREESIAISRLKSDPKYRLIFLITGRVYRAVLCFANSFITSELLNLRNQLVFIVTWLFSQWL